MEISALHIGQIFVVLASSGFFRGGLLMLAHLHQLVHSLDDAEQHERHDQEVDDRCQKFAVV